MTSRTVSYEAGEGFARVTLDHPQRRNALSLETLDALQAALDDAAADPAVRVVFLEAKGRAFCAGMDLKAVRLSDRDEAAQFARALARAYRTLLTLPIPLLCAVDAPVSGGGVGVAAAADLLWAGPEARFSLPETSLGLVPAMVSVVLRRRLAPKVLSGMALGGVVYDAQSAVSVGIADLATEDRAADRLERFLRDLLRDRAPIAMRRTKAFLQRHLASELDQELDEAVAEFRASVASDEAQRGLSAFLRKESVQWNAT